MTSEVAFRGNPWLPGVKVRSQSAERIFNEEVAKSLESVTKKAVEEVDAEDLVDPPKEEVSEPLWMKFFRVRTVRFYITGDTDDLPALTGISLPYVRSYKSKPTAYDNYLKSVNARSLKVFEEIPLDSEPPQTTESAVEVTDIEVKVEAEVASQKARKKKRGFCCWGR